MLFKRKCKITFIAHGATLYTEENRICDKESHPPLNEEGQEEAERIAKWIIHRSPQVDKIYTGSSFKLYTNCTVCRKGIRTGFLKSDRS